ncbi:unnamed protein product [Cylicocyclus nassatus]|uniref:Uncharacterized protein n=1 Tax=Cylicocyclus nassatus TaxID=53992 RepID=A0AA36HAH0_CYLNA|nr:unnamed protein product [Cylicocyclus nassatus]
MSEAQHVLSEANPAVKNALDAGYDTTFFQTNESAKESSDTLAQKVIDAKEGVGEKAEEAKEFLSQKLRESINM